MSLYKRSLNKKYKGNQYHIDAWAYWDRIKISREYEEALMINNMPVATIHGSETGWYIYTLSRVLPRSHDYKYKKAAVKAAEKLFGFELCQDARYMVLNNS